VPEGVREFGATLTVNTARRFLTNFYPERFVENGIEHRICHIECYESMLNYLNSVNDTELGQLLRELWKKYEIHLRMHSTDKNIVPFYMSEERAREKWNQEEAERKWGVYINLLRNADSHKIWFVPYHDIFHEFFHNIYDVANVKDIRHNGIDMIDEFGKIIVRDVNNLLDEENNKTGRRLNNLTFETHQWNKAALYDIIGAVLYKGKYGCNPNNSELYTKDGRRCKDKIGCRLHNKNTCNYIFESGRCYLANSVFYTENEQRRKKQECEYGVNCDLRSNDWCDIIVGHLESYWAEKDTEREKRVGFLKMLAEETFAHMAAEAIVNPEAYKKIKECLPESDKTFRKILKILTNALICQFRT
jgi:hypothetical protein